MLSFTFRSSHKPLPAWVVCFLFRLVVLQFYLEWPDTENQKFNFITPGFNCILKIRFLRKVGFGENEQITLSRLLSKNLSGFKSLTGLKKI